jgi:hypothetical protein
MESEMSEVYDELKDYNPEALIIDDFEEAYLGFSTDGKAIYDFYTMLDVVVEGILEDEDCTEDEAVNDAIQHIETNIISAYVGPYTPIVMYKEIYD